MSTRFLNNIDALVVANTPDIAEKTDFGYYLGYFEKGTDETGEFNCMIIEMRTEGQTTTRKYAEGVNYDTRMTWSKRAEYTYKYGAKNI